MKTLDEVIKALEYCLNPVDNFGNCNAECPYINCCDPSNHDVTEDALHYLKEHQRQMNDPDGDHRQLEKCRALLQDFYCNDPLSWDELRTMEGKPVWVEWTKSEESYWCFVGEWFDDDEMRIYRMGWDYADYIHKTIYTPDIVQAYRKERNDGLSA